MSRIRDIANILSASTDMATDAEVTSSIASHAAAADPHTVYLKESEFNAAGKNIAINGGMDIWQRGTSKTGQGGGTYTADRWFLYAGGQATVSRQATGDTTNLANIQYCARVQRNSSSTDTTIIPLNQSFETVNSIPLVGKTVTLSFYARAGANFSASSNVLIASIVTGTGTDQNQQSGGYTGQVVVTSTSNNLTTTWQRFTATGTVGVTANELALTFYYTPTGTAGAADYFEITGIQLELGSVATPFSRAGGTIQGELAACYRYYYRRNPSGVGYGLATTSAYSTTDGYARLDFPVTMRTAPSLTTTGTASNYRLYVNNLVNLTQISLQFAGTDYALLSVTTGAGGMYAIGAAGWLASDTSGNGFLAFSSEL